MNLLTILHVEDSLEDQEVFARLLRIAGVARGIEVEITAVTRLADIGAGPLFDCILVDLSMMNGGKTSTMDWIAAHASHMPMLMVLSGYAEYDTDCIRRGAEDFVCKGDAVMAPEVLIERIKLGVLRHRLRRMAL